MHRERVKGSPSWAGKLLMAAVSRLLLRYNPFKKRDVCTCVGRSCLWSLYNNICKSIVSFYYVLSCSVKSRESSDLSETRFLCACP